MLAGITPSWAGLVNRRLSRSRCGRTMDAGLQMADLVMYERIGADGRRPSPFSWRIRYALAHKGVPVEFRHVRFADVETIRGLSGQHFVPIVVHGDKVVHDSWNIARYLEDQYPERRARF